MITPAGCTPQSGQYVEIKNTTTFAINLDGLRIGVGTLASFSITGSRIIQPGAYALIRPSFGVSCYPGLGVDLAMPSNRTMTAFGSAAAMRVWIGNATFAGPGTLQGALDLVDYSSFELDSAGGAVTPSGFSMHLDETSASTAGALHIANDDEANWCLGDIALGSPGNFGSANAPRGGCGTPVDTGDSSPSCTPVGDLAVGDLVITEVLFDAPTACFPGSAGQYIEVVNVSGECVDLSGLLLDWGTSPQTNDQPVVPQTPGSVDLADGERALLQRRVSGAVCPDFSTRPGLKFFYDFALGGGDTVLRLKGASGLGSVIDTVNFGLIDTESDRAVGLDPSVGLSATANDDGENWCLQTVFLTGTGGVFGTPLATNSVCLNLPDSGETGETGETGNPTAECLSRPSRDPSDGLVASELCPGDLVITELMVEPRGCAPKERCQYIEVYNASGAEVFPEGLLGAWPTQAIVPLEDRVSTNPASVQPGEYIALFVKTSGTTPAYQYIPNAWFTGSPPPVLRHGRTSLRNAQYTIDAVDLSTLSVTNARSFQLRPEVAVNTASDNDDPADWCVADYSLSPVLGFGGSPTTDAGTPGVENVCPGGDTSDTSDSGVVRNTADGLDAEELLAGELVITEVMLQPTDCGGANAARFIEVFNPTPYTIRPASLRVGVGSNNAGVVDAVLVGADVAPGSYEVLGMTPSTFCYAVERGHAVRNVTLAPGVIRLFNGSGTIDVVDLSAVPVPVGASLQLRPDVTITAAANDNPANWCPSRYLAEGAVNDRASPGRAGDCGSFDTGEPPDSGTDTRTIDDLAVGDLIVSEIHYRTACPAAQAEYIEVFHLGSEPVDLGGLELSINGGTWTVPPGTVIGGFAHGAFVRQATTRCVVPNVTPLGAYSANLAMGSTGVEVILQVPTPATPRVIDIASTVGVVPPPFGRSLQLDDDRLSAVLNDQPGSWCATPALSPYDVSSTDAVGKDYGTPGTPNFPCAADTGIDDTDTNDSFDPDETDPDVEFVDVEALQPGDIVITEVMVTPADCSPQRTAEYIEVYNRRSDRVNLRYLEIYDEEGVAVVRTRAIVEPGGYAILRNITDGLGSRCYGLEGGGYNGGAQLNDNGDTILLRTPSGVEVDFVDLNPLPRVIGQAHELRPVGIPSATTNDDPAAWCLAGDVVPGGRTDRGTPGMPNTCTGDGGGGNDPDIREASELEPGDLVVTEFLPATAEPGCTDANAEWVEIRNASPDLVDLYGVRLTNRFGEGTAVQILEHVYVPSGEVVLGTRFATPRCYPLNTGFVYPGLVFDNRGDRVEILADAGRIDAVDTRGWATIPVGSALSLDAAFTVSATANDLQTAWCLASQAVPSGTVDRGTPAAPNPACPSGEDTDTPPLDTSDTGFPDDTGPTDPTGVALSTLGVGDLRIEELMVDPVDCADARAEYIEIHNLTGQTVDLDGLVVTTSVGVGTVSGSALVGPGGLALGVLDGAPQCHGLPADFTYGAAEMPNAGGVLSVSFGSTTFDSVDYGALGDQSPGRAWTRDAVLTDRWCLALGPFPRAINDQGTPGYENVACGSDVDTDDEPVDTFDTFTPDTGPPPESVGVARVGDLIITEFHPDPQECPDAAGEYIELYNNSTRSFDLDGLILGTEQGAFTVDRPPGRLISRPGEYTLLRSIASTGCYDINADGRYSGVGLGPPAGGSVVYVANETTILDLVDFSGFEGRGGRAWMLDPERLGAPPPGGVADAPGSSSFTGTYLNNDAAAWCQAADRIPGANADKGTPGVANPACIDDDEFVYPPGYVANIEELDPGDLVVTELMVDPVECGDLIGEYIEIVNRFPTAVDLTGLRISTETATTTVNTPVIVPIGGRAVGRKVDDRWDCYDGMAVDFLFPGVTFDNGGDLIRLRNSHSVLDEVDARSWGAYPGRALQLRDGFEDAGSNDLIDNWCFADTPVVPGSTDFGTPGASAASCADLPPILKAPDLLPGDLRITELFPGGTGCLAGNSYMEITNTSGLGVDLDGVGIEITDSIRFIQRPVVLEPGGIALIAFGPFDCINPPRGPDVVIPSTQQDPFGVGEGGGVVRLVVASVTVDRYDYQRTSLTTGIALQRDPDAPFDPVDTDTDLDTDPPDPLIGWCEAFVDFDGAGNRGTPGEPNDCGPDTDTQETHEIDTDLPIDTNDTSVFYDVYIEAFANVTPQAGVNGEMSRVAVPRRYPGRPLTLATVYRGGLSQPVCFYTWQLREQQILDDPAVCPSCEFAFRVRYSGRLDQLQFVAGFPSDCGDKFDAFGGSGITIPDQRLFYSSSYGVLMRQVGGLLVPYAYDVGFNGRAIDWRTQVERIDY